MSIKFYDSDGETEISQVINMFITRIGALDQVGGDTIRKKYFISSDEDANILTTQGSPTIFNPYIIQSDADTEDDLTGDEKKFGIMEVIESTTTHVKVAKGTIIPEDDLWVAVGNDIAQITGTTENDDDYEFDLSVEFNEAPSGYIQLCYKWDAVADENKEFWACVDIAEQQPRNATMSLILRTIL